MIVLAYGVPGAGKSALLHDLVSEQAQAQRFFIVDHEDGWSEGSVHWRGRPPPLRLFRGEEELQAAQEESLPPTGVFVFQSVDAGAVAQLACAKGACTYVDDELDLIARRKGWEESPLRAIVHQGRHLLAEDGSYTQVHLMGACRRPQNLHTDLTDLADQFFVFRLKGRATRDRLLADNLLEDDAEWEELRALPDFHFKHLPSERWLSIAPLGTPRDAHQAQAQGAQGLPRVGARRL